MDAASNPYVQTVEDGGELRIRRTSVISSVIHETKSNDVRRPSTVSGEATDVTNRAPNYILEVEESIDYEDAENTFPEGGLTAWRVVFGSFCMLYPSFGLQVSIGTLQDYWAQNQLSEYSTATVAWIPSLFVYLGLALGLVVGPLFDRYGPKYIVPCGTLAYTSMMFLLAECTKYWQFMLCCGLYGGVCAAFLTTTGLAVVSHWFKERRGLAHGIAMIGSSFGGLTIPLILRATIPRYGYTWSIRILGFIFAGCFMMSNLLMKARVPPKRRGNRSIISFRIFKDPRLCFLTASIFGIEVVLFGALGILPTYATLATDFPADTGFYLISVLNGVSCLGRVIPGYLADKMGRFNVFLIAMVCTLVFILGIWLPFGATSIVALYLFAALFGFATGSWMALVPACVGQLCRADEFGTYYGSMYFVAGLSLLVAIPVSGELVEASGAPALVAFSGGVLGLSIVTFVASRWACLGWKWSWTAKI